MFKRLFGAKDAGGGGSAAPTGGGGGAGGKNTLSAVEKLKDVRNRLAKSERVPAYVIFSNQTLEHLTRLRPTSLEAGLNVKWIGEAKAAKYLEPFLRVLREEEAS